MGKRKTIGTNSTSKAKPTNSNSTAKKSRTKPPPTDLFQQIFSPALIKFLLASTILLICVVVAVRLFKSYAANNKENILSPGQFTEQYGKTVGSILLSSILAFVVSRSIYYRIKRWQQHRLNKSLIKATKKKRGPRLTFPNVEYKLYQGARQFSNEEQELFEELLSVSGVPSLSKLDEWNVLALSFIERTGTDLQFRYKAVTKALQEAEKLRQQQSKQSKQSKQFNEKDDFTTEANDLSWWLSIGLKQSDERQQTTSEQYVYNEADDDYVPDVHDENKVNQQDVEERARVEIELHPKQTGTTLTLEGSILLHKVGTARIDDCNLHIQCTRCDITRDVVLSGTFANNSEKALWCSKCKKLMRLNLRPVLMHQANHTFCHIDTEGCVILDVLPSNFIASCEMCWNEDVKFDKFQRGRRIEKNCMNCGIKLAMFAKQIVINDLNIGSSSQSGKSNNSNSGKSKPNQKSKTNTGAQNIRLKLGENLPNLGACKHFKKSNRWMRFSCCGKLYPCPVCHELAGECEDAATKLATRMVCGKCSCEQPMTSGKCIECAYHMGKGGRDTRQSTMSKKDRKKKAPSSSSSKKTVSKKSQRVGQAGKVKREKAKIAKQMK